MTRRRVYTPETCKHRHWSPVIDLRTGRIDPTREGCWYCGTVRTVPLRTAPEPVG